MSGDRAPGHRRPAPRVERPARLRAPPALSRTGVIGALRTAWRSSPRRTFVVLPLAATAYELVRGRSPVRGGSLGLALLAAGYALYCGAGAYRGGRGGGGPGFAAGPDR